MAMALCTHCFELTYVRAHTVSRTHPVIGRSTLHTGLTVAHIGIMSSPNACRVRVRVSGLKPVYGMRPPPPIEHCPYLSGPLGQRQPEAPVPAPTCVGTRPPLTTTTTSPLPCVCAHACVVATCRHVHAYERMWPVFQNQTSQKNYTNPPSVRPSFARLGVSAQCGLCTHTHWLFIRSLIMFTGAG
jgi:hypothetical protein